MSLGSWKINDQVAGDNGVKDITITIRNQSVDTALIELNLRAHENQDQLPFGIDEGVIVKIKHNDAQVFFGTVTEIKGLGATREESITVKVQSGMWYYDNLVHRQAGSRYHSSPAPPEKVTRVDLSGQINAIMSNLLNTPNSEGTAPVEAGNVDLSTEQIIERDMRDATYGEVIRFIMGRVPSAYTFFDYSAATAKCNVGHGLSATQWMNINVDSGSVKDVKYWKRYDLQVPHVKIYYEHPAKKSYIYGPAEDYREAEDSDVWVYRSSQEWPTSGAEGQLRGVVKTVSLGPTRTYKQISSLIYRRPSTLQYYLYGNNSSGIPTQRHIIELYQAYMYSSMPADLRDRNSSNVGSYWTYTSTSLGVGIEYLSDNPYSGDFPFYLFYPTHEKWHIPEDLFYRNPGYTSGLKVVRADITFNFLYRKFTSDPWKYWTGNLSVWAYHGWSHGTNLVRLVETTETALDPVPSQNIAKQLYEGINAVVWEGSVRVLDGLNLLHNPAKRTIYLTQNSGPTLSLSIIQQAVFRASDDSSEYSFGPPDHLSVQDLIEFQRFNSKPGVTA